MKPIILNLETTTSVCSVALAQGDELLASTQTTEANNHATHLTPFIEQVFKEAEISLQSVDAIAVSLGPGSYTGLRIGFSTAKGLCYALNKPLITIDTLQALAFPKIQQLDDLPEETLIAPMIDARRMEVYCSLYNRNLEKQLSIEGRIVTENLFLEYLEQHPIIFCGNGAFKINQITKHNNTIVQESECNAKNMIALSHYKYKNTTFDNVLEATPFYVKAPFITKPKKRL